MNIHLAALLALIQSVHALSANDDVTGCNLHFTTVITTLFPVPDLPAEVAPPTRHKVYNLKVDHIVNSAKKIITFFLLQGQSQIKTSKSAADSRKNAKRTRLTWLWSGTGGKRVQD